MDSASCASCTITKFDTTHLRLNETSRKLVPNRVIKANNSMHDLMSRYFAKRRIMFAIMRPAVRDRSFYFGVLLFSVDFGQVGYIVRK